MTETRGERKLVTLLFADLTGYTALAAALDPEDVFSFIRPTMAELQRVVEDHGGTVPQVQGDGFMAVFGVPSALEDDAERAVRAALAVRDRVRELNEGRSGIAIPEVHSGVNSGEVMVGPSAEASGIAVVGDVVNTASRLADLAAPGTVLVEEQPWRRTRHAIRYGRRRSLVAKGKPQPLAAYEALAPRTSLPVGRASPLVGGGFVDREPQLTRLSDALQEAVDEELARVVVVTAEPGAGKTRLAAEFTRRNPSALVLTGRATAYGARQAFSPLAAAVGEIAGVTPGSPAASSRRRIQALAERVAVGADARHLARQLAVLLGTGQPAEGRGAIGASDALDAARAVVEGLALERPVIVVLDDLQWADPAVVDALDPKAARAWAGPILILGLARAEAAVRFVPGVRLELDAIHEEAMEELASLALGAEALPPSLLAVVTRAGGNPLFLEESLSMLIEAGALASSPAGWRVTDAAALRRVPTTVRALIAARLDGLPDEEKRLLQCASVTGEHTSDRLLRSLLPDVDVRSALRSSVARGLLRRRRGQKGRKDGGARGGGARLYSFKHALIRDVAYGSLPRQERARLHLEVAGYLRAPTPDREPVEALAHHYAEAWRLSSSAVGHDVPVGLASSAATYLGRWADETLASQALRAEPIYATAIEVGDAAPDEVGPELRARHLVGRAECLIELGRHREAEAVASTARSMADRAGDEHLGARALVALGRIESDVGDDEVALAMVSEALTYFESIGDRSGQAWATHRLSEIAGRTDYAEGLDHLRAAHALFVASKDRWGRVIASQDLAYMLSTVGGSEFHHWYREAKQLAEGDGDLRSKAELLRTLGYYQHYCGEHEQAIATMREARPLAIAAGDRYAEADTLLIEALAAAMVSPPRDAASSADTAVAFGREIRSARVQALGTMAGARCAVRLGDPARAARLLTAGRRALVRSGAETELLEADLAIAEVHLDRGSFERVVAPAERARVAAALSGERLLEPAAMLAIGRAALGSGSRDAVSRLSDAAGCARSSGATGTLAIAQAARDQASLLAGRTPRPRTRAAVGVIAEAIETENEGTISFREGAYEEAAASFREAVERWRPLSSTVWLARATAMNGEALRRSGDRRGAAAARSRARRLLDRIDTPPRDRDAILTPLGSPPDP